MNNNHNFILTSNIDINSITEQKGDGYENWIRITKQKLQERERQSMSIRISAIQNIINDQCESFEKMNSLNSVNNIDNNNCSLSVLNYNNILTNNYKFIDECLNKLYLSISLWSGVNLTKTKKSLSTFNKYFAIGKCWFDQKKKCILAPEFWVKLFIILDEFTIESANIYFNNRFPKLQTLYAKCLQFRFICGIFNGQIHFAVTKPQPLISCGIIKDSHPMKQYLNTLHKSLNIQTIIKQHSPESKKINAKQVLNLVNKQLVYLTDKYSAEFKTELYNLYNDKNIIFNQTENNNNSNIRPPTWSNNNMNQYTTDTTPQLPMIANISNDSTDNSNNSNSNNSNNSGVLELSAPIGLPAPIGCINSQCTCRCNCMNMNMSANANMSANMSANNSMRVPAVSVSDRIYSGYHTSSQSVMSDRYNPLQFDNNSYLNNHNMHENVTVINNQNASVQNCDYFDMDNNYNSPINYMDNMDNISMCGNMSMCMDGYTGNDCDCYKCFNYLNYSFNNNNNYNTND